MKKTLASILFVFAVYTAFSQQPINGNKQYTGIAIFDTTVAFHDFTIQTSGTDTLYTITSGSNSTLSHGNGSLLLNTSKATIGNFGTTGYKVAATSGNIQLQQGSTDSITITFSNDTAHLSATVSAWDFSPALPGGSSGWSLTGNAGTTPGTNYVGTSDYKDLQIKRNGNTNIEITADNKGEHVNIVDSLGNQLFATTSDAGSFSATVGSDSAYLAADNGTGEVDINATLIVLREDQHTACTIFTLADSILNPNDTTTYIGTASFPYREMHANRFYGSFVPAELDSATIYALTPSNGTQYYCTDCTGNGITGRIVAFIAAAWRRLLFED